MPLAFVNNSPLVQMDRVLPTKRIFPVNVMVPRLVTLGGPLVGSYKGVDETAFHIGRYAQYLRAWTGKDAPTAHMQRGLLPFSHVTKDVRVDQKTKTIYADIAVHDNFYGRRLCALMDVHGPHHFKLFGEMDWRSDGTVYVVTDFRIQTLDFFVPK